MRWEYCKSLYLNKFCCARGLRTRTIAAYSDALDQFEEFAIGRLDGIAPEKISMENIFTYVEYLRNERNNQNGAVNRAVVILKNMYRALVAMGHLDPRDNPMRDFPKMKAPKRKFKDTLSEEEIGSLIDQPRTDTVMGLRDRAIISLLYCTGIRVSECAGFCENDVIINERIIRVTGKGGDERVLPLNDDIIEALKQYQKVRGICEKKALFFRSRKKTGMARNTIYMVVKKNSRCAKINKNVSPHVLRHSFATHLIQRGENVVVVKELLGHRLLSSTQVYLHMTAADIRGAIERHPIRKLMIALKDFLPDLRLPFQNPPGTKYAFSKA